ncbi:MAG: carbon-nitrogen hydrolase family protein [Kineosporiaceae bacterium]|nr:carbon-nitrogen hydrolase family protein [Aeromicrobium sp.]
MHIALVQFAAVTDSAANRAVIDSMLGRLGPDDGLDLVVLPEGAMHDFGTPDHDLSAIAEPLDGPFVQLLAGHARRLGATVIGGMFEATSAPTTKSLPFNTLVVLGPDGSLRHTYRKIHLYDSFGYRESQRLSPGDVTPVVIDVAGRSVGLMTCYDLRFPELARILIEAGAEVLAIPSAWVQGKIKLDHWTTLLRARAIENTVPVIAVGQCGEHYVGHSLVIDARGSIVEEAGAVPATLRAELDFAEVERVRAENPSLTNRRIRSAP